MTGALAGMPTLVGRTAELERCDRLIEAALGGRGTLLLVSGEAGIGKTALVTAIGARAEARGARFAVGRCFADDALPAFAPWQELFAGVRRAAAASFEPAPPPFGEHAGSRTAYELRQMVTRALTEAAAQQPLLLCLDDVHWADPDTLELLWFVARELGSARILLAATFRSDDVDRHHPLAALLPRLQHDCPTEHLRLSELTVSETAELIASRSGPCTRALAAHLHARSDGNPFYVVELLRDLHEQRLLERDAAGRWSPPGRDVPVPSILEHIIVQRIARLGEDTETLLKVAAVVGQAWQLRVVEVVLEWDESRLLAALEAALTAHTIVHSAETPETYRFGHALFREVLYGQLIVRRRKHLHHQVGVALEAHVARDGDAAVHAALAAQFAAADDWPRTVRYALSAGDWSRARYATHTALRLYELARSGLERLDQDTASTGPSTVDVASTGPSTVDVASTGSSTVDVAVRLHERIAKLHMVLNQQELALAAFSRMLELARTAGDRLAEGEALVWQSAILARINRMAQAQLAANDVLTLAEHTGDRRLRALAHRSIGHVQVLLGDDLVQAEEHVSRGAQLARAGKHVDALGPCLYDLAVLRVWRADYPAAERLAEEALALAKTSRDVGLCLSACFSLGLARTERGRYQAALHVLRLGIETATDAGELRNVAKLMNTLAGLHDDLGDVEAAQQWSQRALEAARSGHDAAVLEAERYALLGLASAALHQGQVAASERYLATVEPLLEVTPYARFRYRNRYQLLRAELALATDAAVEARRWVDQARTLAESKGMRKNVARSWLLGGRALLSMGAGQQAIVELRQGVGIADATQHAALGWQGRVWLAQALAAHRQPEAIDVAREAQERIEAIAAALPEARLRGCFLDSALVQQARQAVATGRSGVHSSKPTHPAGLSAREVEVLRLVASGATNAHVAQVLSISPRTVDVHMTSVLAKTGSANRTAAVAFALRHGLT